LIITDAKTNTQTILSIKAFSPLFFLIMALVLMVVTSTEAAALPGKCPLCPAQLIAKDVLFGQANHELTEPLLANENRLACLPSL